MPLSLEIEPIVSSLYYLLLVSFFTMYFMHVLDDF